MLGSSLESLSLKSLSSLENLPSLIDRLPNSSRLRELSIIGVPNFMPSLNSSRVEIQHFRSLRKLAMDFSMGSAGSIEEVDSILHECSHLI